MILFVFEGKKREPNIFKTLEYLYFPKGQMIVCSLRYTKSLPDTHFHEYSVSRANCHDKGFKFMAQQFETQNVLKANYLCNNKLEIPADKNSISQYKIFIAQQFDYIKPKNEVAVLSAFPIFIFEYFKREG